jgi:hypothetical protein
MLMHFGLSKFCVVNPRESHFYTHSAICTNVVYVLINSLELHMIDFL